MSKELLEKIDNMIERIAMTELHTGKSEGVLIDKNTLLDIKKELELKSIDNTKPSEALNITKATEKYTGIDLSIVKKALQRLDKYEQILGSGRLTDRNYENTTLALESCSPYIRLGRLEDIYEENKKND